uniref:Protein CASC3 n=1 Tax=Loa loa TaxID=7209 RepID=A0A1I7VE55_LOALO
MAKRTTAEARMTREEDPEILDIIGTISKMKIVDNEQSRNAEDETVNIRENEYPKTSPRDEISNIKQLKSPDDDEEVSGPDQDQDQAHPAYIPRIGQFFMHDTRETGERITLHPLSRTDYKWRHDLYNETDQMPMSDREFAKKYGVDREGNPVSSVRRVKNFVNMLRLLKQDNFTGKNMDFSEEFFMVSILISYCCISFSVGLLAPFLNCYKNCFRLSGMIRMVRTKPELERQQTFGTHHVILQGDIGVRSCFFNNNLELYTSKFRGRGTDYQDKRKGVKKRGSDGRLPFAGNPLNKEHSSDWKNQKLDGGKEAESKSEINSRDHNHAKMEIRLGKRYSTQRPMKSAEM